MLVFMGYEYILSFLEEQGVAVVKKMKNEFLNDSAEDIYVLKDGIVKVSKILEDGREHNITYLKAPDMVTLFKNRVCDCDSNQVRIRIESEDATFYCVSKPDFVDWVKQDAKLRECVDDYYLTRLIEAIYRQRLMMMNSKKGAVCALIYYLIPLFGKRVRDGMLIDQQVTNDDIAGFCGISTCNSVNRILRMLRDENVIRIVYNKILILNTEYLKEYI